MFPVKYIAGMRGWREKITVPYSAPVGADTQGRPLVYNDLLRHPPEERREAQAFNSGECESMLPNGLPLPHGRGSELSTFCRTTSVFQWAFIN